MKKNLLIATLFGISAIVSCKKSDDSATTDPITTGTLNDIKVPAGFNWESSRNINVSVKITDNRFKDAIHQIAVYNGDPFTGGTLLSQGSATVNSDFITKIYLSNQVTELYVMKTAPDKSKIVQKVTVGTADVAVTIGSTDPSVAVKSVSGSGLKIQETPTINTDCNSGCTLPVITTNTSNVDLNNGDVLCITGSNITVNFRNLNGGTIRICGTNVTAQNLNLSGSTTLLVTASGSLNLAGFNFNSASASVINYGTITIPSSFADNGIFSNYGTFSCGADYNLNAQAGLFTNSGTMTVGGTFNDGTTAVATNSGSLTVGGSFQPNSNSNFVNNCSLTVGGNYNQSSGVKNYSLIAVGGTSTINANAELGLYNSAMLKTNGLIVDGSIKGYGSTSLVKIMGTTAIQNAGAIISNVQIYAVNGINQSSSNHISGGATLGNSVYIPTTGCNSEGNGTPTVTDADGDGVADNLDAYPTDPNEAYNVTGATGTLAFEDQWPRKGDFDLNDLVVSYKYNLVTSGANKVVSVDGYYTLLATGGNFGNAFALEFPVATSKAKNLMISKGGSTPQSVAFEAGQNNAVVVLFKDMRREMSVWNTKPGDNVQYVTRYSIYFKMTDGPTLSDFGLDAYNPFIWNVTRGSEVHLPGKKPTTLADASFFGTNDDDTNVNAGRYYVTKTGLPYAINIPAATFAYPFEGIDITQTYLHFGDWAASGGLQYTDWYSNTASYYRDNAKVFTH